MSDDLSTTALEYVLGSLPGEERAAFARRLESDPAARAALHGWERRLAPLATAVDAVEPDPAAWSAIESRLDPPRRSADVIPLRRAVARWRSVAVATSALAAALAVFVISRPGLEVQRAPRQAAAQPAASPPVASLNPAPRTVASADGPAGVVVASGERPRDSALVTASGGRDAPGGGLVVGAAPSRDRADATYVAALTSPAAPAAFVVRVDAGQGALVARNLSARAPAGSYLQLWLLTSDGARVSLGRIDGEMTRVPLPRDLPLAGATVAVSIEPDDGGTPQSPRGAFIFEGRLTRE